MAPNSERAAILRGPLRGHLKMTADHVSSPRTCLALSVAAAEGIQPDDLESLAVHSRVHEVVSAGVHEAMADFNHAEQIKKFVILAVEWLPDSDELTPTSKLKRRNIETKYADEIRSMYADGPHS